MPCRLGSGWDPGQPAAWGGQEGPEPLAGDRGWEVLGGWAGCPPVGVSPLGREHGPSQQPVLGIVLPPYLWGGWGQGLLSVGHGATPSKRSLPGTEPQFPHLSPSSLLPTGWGRGGRGDGWWCRQGLP